MENQRVELKDLQLEDEVIVGGSGDINYFKILREPQKRTNVHVHNRAGYKAIKVELNHAPLGRDARWDKIKYYDFNYKTIWLVKRKNKI